ncbi:DHS-like NAD/FAD-binding domain-containing protein [Mycena belliarum]|uniref:DHS-like NAD/FAD-binding domain-containing protein n=1 Tax=Mycena belliarum TaxID=1033014 RepID=A0AAD6U4G3_9AGAR|nr:DHS-like NAD/FAD-binding domain-containing protein [Mycena belliae]
MSLATPEAFTRNPLRVWQFYNYRREAARAAMPNAAHMALAAFSLPSRRKAVAPDAEFAIVTQNVDCLSTKAMEMILKEHVNDIDEAQANTAPLLEMHGRIFDVQCTLEFCEHVEYDTSSLALKYPALAAEDEEAGGTDSERERPVCSRCTAFSRPGVVWFGEMPKYMEQIDELVEAADLCLVVGTSSTVYPAAGYASVVRRNGGKVAVFNLERSKGDSAADFLFLGPCEETLPEALSNPSH